MYGSWELADSDTPCDGAGLSEGFAAPIKQYITSTILTLNEKPDNQTTTPNLDLNPLPQS